jgi:hypothetical protein
MRTAKGGVYIAVSMGAYKYQRLAYLLRDRSGRMLSIPGGMEGPPPVIDAMVGGILGELVMCAHGMAFREVFGRAEIVEMETRPTPLPGVTI